MLVLPTAHRPLPTMELFNRLFSTSNRCSIDIPHPIDQIIIGHGDGVGVKGVGGDYIGAGLEISVMDIDDCFWLRDGEQIVTAFQVAPVVDKLLAAKFRLAKCQLLNHGAHRAIEDQNPLGEKVLEDFIGL